MPGNLLLTGQYTHTTLAEARSQLTAQLQDASTVYWSTSWLDALIVESLRTWNALTGFYRARLAFETSPLPGGAFYDLAQMSFGSALNYSVTDTQLISAVLNHLLESTIRTNQFTDAQILAAVQNALNRFLGDTGVVVTWTQQPVSSPPIGRIPLSDSVIDVRRAAWGVIGGGAQWGIDNWGEANWGGTLQWYPLWRQDEFAMDSFATGWPQTPTQPRSFSVSVTPPVQLQVAPPPLNAGILELLSVFTGTPLTGAGVPLGIPDDLSWAVKWAALATLFNTDGQSRDPARAAYCIERYKHGLAAAALPSVLRGRINDIPVPTGSVFDADAFLPSWESGDSKPRFIGLAGRNLLAVCPTSSTKYGVSIDTVVNFPVPVVDGDHLQVGREDLTYVLDYAQHLACLQMGGAEFEASMPLLQTFLQGAVVRNARLKGTTVDKFDLELPAGKQAAQYERVEGVTAGGVNA